MKNDPKQVVNELAQSSFDERDLTAVQVRLQSFLRYLKANGFRLDIEGQCLAQQLLAANDYGDSRYLQHTLAIVLCKNSQQWQQYDRLFDEYWKPKGRQQMIKKPDTGPSSAKRDSRIEACEQGEDTSLVNEKKRSYQAKAGQNSELENPLHSQASANNGSEKLDFCMMSEQQLQHQFKASCTELADFFSKRMRKVRNSTAGEKIDLRQSMQRSLKHGGEMIDLVYLKRPKVAPSFTLLIDVSRSMSHYSNAFLIFAWALMQVLPNARVFVFNTTLIELTESLKSKGLAAVQGQLEMLANAWGGGTRIASSLQLLAKRAAKFKRGSHYFLVHSDGLDTDPPMALAAQLKKLKKQCRSIIWLSPLLKDSQYSVETASLKNALGEIDHFLPIHNMQCLTNLVQIIVNGQRQRLTLAKYSSERYR